MKTAFLDRDGVINKGDRDYVVDWSKFEFIPGSIEAIKLLTENNYRVIIITNQSGIDKRFFTHKELAKLHNEMKEIIEYYGGYIDDVYYCPHRPDAGCGCRKPKPGMIQRAAKKYNIDLSESCMVGDWVWDMEASKAAGCGKLILVKTGDKFEIAKQKCKERGVELTYVAEDLLDAVKKLVC